MNGEDAELLLTSIDESFGLTAHDFEENDDGKLVPIYTKWGDKEMIDIEDLKHRSLKISKNIGDIYIDKISTDCWIIVGKGTKLHCADMHAGLGVVNNFDGFLL